ncbi:MAG: hypothetical protein QNJ72_04685 [Pleurocapsa sp. MO_226.B13]|nr:hypothetical protein [Pleurocapsa sp. MO_226.B13]
MPSLVTERIESVKAGIVGAVAFAIAELVTTIARAIIIAPRMELSSTPIMLNWELLVQLAIGMVSGFLFGVTYRYIIRNEGNSHLNDGAVLAFGLVRGLALIEKNLVWSELLALISLIIQSIICFALARLILDLAISRKLIKPFV